MNLTPGSRLTINGRDYALETVTIDKHWISMILHSVDHLDQQSRENRAEIDAWVKTLPWRKRISTQRRLRKSRSQHDRG
ncbi:hypothetical protein EDF42_2146 [Curtobacterium sp. PhB172]|uniref:hypothetical protein n=1 Tax=Curtobacterium sp. PhB172 TaxID=2485196 RepID=UPI000F4C9EA1|nr:hypothetical protein [Curtobacterium sp. PhB172]ROS63892.1 hypothetical protein EDF42_2146 [Curtobacterium sp. PhB172]